MGPPGCSFMQLVGSQTQSPILIQQSSGLLCCPSSAYVITLFVVINNNIIKLIQKIYEKQEIVTLYEAINLSITNQNIYLINILIMNMYINEQTFTNLFVFYLIYKVNMRILQNLFQLIHNNIISMFLAEAIADFSPELAQNNQTSEQVQDYPAQKQQTTPLLNKQIQQPQKIEIINNQNNKQDEQKEVNSKQQSNFKRAREVQHQKQINNEGQTETITYLNFKKGDKIVTRMTYENGWWFGNVLKNPDVQGFFPSTFVKVGTEAPLPQMPPDAEKEDWLTQQLQKVNKGPVQSQYYQGITGYKMVKIDDRNKNILKANYVKFDSATGLAKVPIKSQQPNAKAVRQMGYFFDYHEWCEQRNKNPQQRARPDVRRKKKKKLNLVLFGQDRNKK